MRDPKRIREIMQKFEELWNRSPDQRFGQMLENFIFVKGERDDKTSVAMFYQEDDITLKRLDGYIEISKMADKARLLNHKEP
jgi:hypothetical protein